jgi:hypothetical protein
MTSNALNAAVLAAVLAAAPAASNHALARAPAPPIPTALVEDVKSTSAGIEFMDYVGTGQVIKLEPGDVLVLSYLRSCEHETIIGGTVHIGPSTAKFNFDFSGFFARIVPLHMKVGHLMFTL